MRKIRHSYVKGDGKESVPFGLLMKVLWERMGLRLDLERYGWVGRREKGILGIRYGVSKRRSGKEQGKYRKGKELVELWWLNQIK